MLLPFSRLRAFRLVFTAKRLFFSIPRATPALSRLRDLRPFLRARLVLSKLKPPRLVLTTIWPPPSISRVGSRLKALRLVLTTIWPPPSISRVGSRLRALRLVLRARQLLLSTPRAEPVLSTLRAP